MALSCCSKHSHRQKDSVPKQSGKHLDTPQIQCSLHSFPRLSHSCSICSQVFLHSGDHVGKDSIYVFRNFGIFAGLTLVLNYLLLITFLPAFLVIQSHYLNPWQVQQQTKKANLLHPFIGLLVSGRVDCGIVSLVLAPAIHCQRHIPSFPIKHIISAMIMCRIRILARAIFPPECHPPNLTIVGNLCEHCLTMCCPQCLSKADSFGLFHWWSFWAVCFLPAGH